ncbi:MAG: carbohydrate-binding domain-containing protein [Oscillospiraceae bacterium]|nr:carbohydrate-binding domain-containing protein [Oscillospiraceae bacterium]
MKHRLKGLLALVLSLTMVFALATNAWAVAVRVDWKTISDNSYWIYNENEWFSGSEDSYNVHLSNDTLTLNNFVYDGYSGISATGDLKIVLNGTNTVTATWSGGGHAVFVDGGSLTIDGTGTLTAKTIGDDHHALYASGNRSIYINGGEVTAKSNSDTAVVAGSVTITGDDTKLTATGQDKGISATYGEFKINGGEVTASGVDNGIEAKNLTISDGKVTATSNDGNGICAFGNLTISGGEVTAEGDVYGIFGNETTTITGGTVTAKATNNTIGVGIKATDSITIGGANNPTVEVGCATGLKASTVNILENSIVRIDAALTAIDSSTLNFGGNWYQWSTNNPDETTPVSSATKAFALNNYGGTGQNPVPTSLIIEKISTGAPGNTNPYPPIIYNPTPTPEPEVTAPKTFDGGIASAVVVTILSATGGAWLAKKKD